MSSEITKKQLNKQNTRFNLIMAWINDADEFREKYCKIRCCDCDREDCSAPTRFRVFEQIT